MPIQKMPQIHFGHLAPVHKEIEVGVLLGPKAFGLSLLIRSRPRLSPSHLGTTETPKTIRQYSFVQLYLILVLDEARCSLELKPCFDFSHVAHCAMLKGQPSGIN